MENYKYLNEKYQYLMQKRSFGNIKYKAKEDLESILDIRAEKRSSKQKKKINWLRKVIKLAEKKKIDFNIARKLDS